MAVAATTVIATAACTHSTSPNAAPNSHDGSSKTPVRPISCSEQYRTWKQGEGKALMDALNAVSSAVKDNNKKHLTRALKQAKPAVAKAAKHPIPACADPRGYWDVLLMHVNAAAAGKASASNVRAALDGVQNIHRQLLAEVAKAAR
jgi:hypothetical protein